MAILRGGRRIGNYDIRIGLPRDKSLDNVNADERLRRKPGGNPETTINRFIAQINQGEGLARPTRYLVIIQPPQKVQQAIHHADEFADNTPARNDLESGETKRNVGMLNTANQMATITFVALICSCVVLSKPNKGTSGKIKNMRAKIKEIKPPTYPNDQP